MDRWWDRAACKGMDPDMWFPERGETGLGNRSPALAVCRRCPVQVECLDAGMDEPVGIWGGLTVQDRERIRGRRIGSAAKVRAPTVRAPGFNEARRKRYAEDEQYRETVRARMRK